MEYGQHIYNIIFINPLLKLYLNGPVAYNIGFWNGDSPTVMCSKLTSYTEIFWDNHHEECLLMIKHKFITFKISIETLIYFSCLFHMIYTTIHYICHCTLGRRNMRRQVYEYIK